MHGLGVGRLVSDCILPVSVADRIVDERSFRRGEGRRQYCVGHVVHFLKRLDGCEEVTWTLTI